MKTFVKKHKKLVIFLGIVLLLVLWIATSINKQLSILIPVEAAKIEVSNLENAVNVDGIVESENSKKIFTQMALPVEKNLVEVGDAVKEGDVLCELDTRTLEQQIKQQSAQAGSQAAINNNTIELSKKQLENAQKDIEGSMNGQIAAAEQAVVAAEQMLNSAEVNYDNTVHTLQEHRKLRRETGIDGDEADSALAQYENARDSAYASYESAKESLIAAKENLEIAKNTTKRQIEGYTDSINTSKVAASSTNSQWIAINFLKEDIDRAVITSPINGVVTAIYVTEGANATGLLYVVEDVENLQIVAKLKEYDISLVKEGNPVKIKSDATGDGEFEGKVLKIAPTTSKTPTGDNTSTNPEFDTEISVEAKSSGLRVGTKARVDIIYESKEKVITVPSDAITLNAEGKEIVYILEPQEKEEKEVKEGEEKAYLVKAVPVEIGMEGDFDIEVISDSLKEGDLIAKDTKNLAEGMMVKIVDELAANRPATGNMRMGG